PSPCIPPLPHPTLFPYTTLFRSFLDTFTDMDAVTRAVIEGTISGTHVGAIELGDMLAAGGTVTINADTLSGNGTAGGEHVTQLEDRKSTRLNSSHVKISYAVFCL